MRTTDLVVALPEIQEVPLRQLARAQRHLLLKKEITIHQAPASRHMMLRILLRGKSVVTLLIKGNWIYGNLVGLVFALPGLCVDLKGLPSLLNISTQHLDLQVYPFSVSVSVRKNLFICSCILLVLWSISAKLTSLAINFTPSGNSLLCSLAVSRSGIVGMFRSEGMFGLHIIPIFQDSVRDDVELCILQDHAWNQKWTCSAGFRALCADLSPVLGAWYDTKRPHSTYIERTESIWSLLCCDFTSGSSFKAAMSCSSWFMFTVTKIQRPG